MPSQPCRSPLGKLRYKNTTDEAQRGWLSRSRGWHERGHLTKFLVQKQSAVNIWFWGRLHKSKFPGYVQTGCRILHLCLANLGRMQTMLGSAPVKDWECLTFYCTSFDIYINNKKTETKLAADILKESKTHKRFKMNVIFNQTRQTDVQILEEFPLHQANKPTNTTTNGRLMSKKTIRRKWHHFLSGEKQPWDGGWVMEHDHLLLCLYVCLPNEEKMPKKFAHCLALFDKKKQPYFLTFHVFWSSDIILKV